MDAKELQKYLDLFEKRVLRSIRNLSNDVRESLGLESFDDFRNNIDESLKEGIENVESTSEDYTLSVLLGELYVIRKVKKILGGEKNGR